MNTPRRVLVLYLVALLVACGGSGTPTPAPGPTPNPNPAPNPVPAPNNSAVLTGAALGAGTTPNRELQKVIGVSPSPNPAFRLGAAYATRTSVDSQTLDWFISVTNQSDSLLCFVRATNIEFRDSTGATLVVDELDYVSGSVGVGQESDLYTDTCLQGGETGYLFGIELELEVASVYSLASSVVIGALDGDAGFTVPAARLIPQRYAVADTFAVTVRNDGTGAARLGEFSHYFLLGDDGRPLTWDFFGDDVAGDPVAAGDTLSLQGRPFYDGLASRAQVNVDFKSPAEPVSPPEFARSARAEPTELLRRYAAWRNQREEAKRNGPISPKHPRQP